MNRDGTDPRPRGLVPALILGTTILLVPGCASQQTVSVRPEPLPRVMAMMQGVPVNVGVQPATGNDEVVNVGETVEVAVEFDGEVRDGTTLAIEYATSDGTNWKDCLVDAPTKFWSIPVWDGATWSSVFWLGTNSPGTILITAVNEDGYASAPGTLVIHP